MERGIPRSLEAHYAGEPVDEQPHQEIQKRVEAVETKEPTARRDWLREYATKAKRLYDEVQGEQRTEKDLTPEERTAYAQYVRTTAWPDPYLLVEYFRDRVRASSGIATELRELEDHHGATQLKDKMKLQHVAAWGTVQRLIREYGPLLEHYHRLVLRRERPYYREFMPKMRHAHELKVALEGLSPTGEATQEFVDEGQQKIRAAEITIEQATEEEKATLILPKQKL